MKDKFSRNSHKKLIVVLLLMSAVVAAIVISFGVIRQQGQSYHAQNIKIDGVYLTTPRDIADFQLTTNTNKPFTKENLKGHVTLMFFGFTNCSYVCPTTMVALNQMYKTLQAKLPANQQPQIVMVSVDPERDTVARMNSYINSFNPNFIGTRGSLTQTQALAKQLNVVAIKVQQGKGKNDYYMDHSAEILVFNADGQLQAYLSYPHKPEQMVKDYRLILKTLGS